MLDRVLVPLDRSKVAEQVFPTVTELAKAFGSEVVIVGIYKSEDREEEQACQLNIDNKVKAW